MGALANRHGFAATRHTGSAWRDREWYRRHRAGGDRPIHCHSRERNDRASGGIWLHRCPRRLSRQLYHSRRDLPRLRASGADRSQPEHLPQHRHVKWAWWRTNRHPVRISSGSRARNTDPDSVVNWWSYCSDVTREVFGEDGGHAGNTETAFMLAVDPSLVQKEFYSGPEMATAIPAPNTWSAYPFPSSILLYTEGQGYPAFDPAKARVFFDKVNDKIAGLIEQMIEK